MDLFYRYNRKYNFRDFKVQIKNIELIDFYQDDYCIERKPKNLKYFKEPKLTAYPIDLNEGYERHRFRDIAAFYGNSLSKVINWDVKQNSTNSNPNKEETLCIYTHRHAIVKIIQSHFNKKGCKFLDWNLYVTKFGNKLYMYDENDESRHDDKEKKNCYHYKLEQILFSDSPYTEPKTDVPVDENIRLSGIYRCQLGAFNIIYSAEIQGIISENEIKDTCNIDLLNQCRFVNAKVYAAERTKYFFGQEFLRYFNNYLVNVDVTYWAFRDEEGFVHDPIKPIKTSDMCKNVRWNPKEYEQFLYDFIAMIVEKMSHVNSLETTYEFNYNSIDKAVYYKIHEGKSDKSFLNADYINFIEKKNNLKEFLNK